jgi:glycosyltransferase involved in cell wall biosynthesis
MKIGFDAKRAFHNFRGLGNYSRTLIESLVKYYPEHHYSLYTPSFKDDYAISWQNRFKQLDVITPPKVFNKATSSIWRSFLLSKQIQADGVDLYHGLSHELPSGIKKSGIPSVVTIHDLIYLRFPEYFPWIDRQVYDRKFRYATESADIVIAICNQTKNDLIHYFGVPEEKIRIVYQSCHPNFYTRYDDEQCQKVLEKWNISDHYILYVGALEPRKNALTLVKAFSRIKDLIPHNLVLVGSPDKDYLKKIKKAIVDGGVTDRVIFPGFISNEEMPLIYQKADAFIYPAEFEGWGIPVVEALFSEVPVITSKTSCLPESSGEYSIHIDPHNVEELATNLETVLYDDDKRKLMIHQGRLHAENFHWKKTSKSLMDVYQKLL